MSQKKQDIKKLKELLEDMPENQKSVADKLLSRIDFMDKTLNKLQRQIRNEGAIITALNGNGFKTITEHPAQKSYNTMIGRYNALVKTFIDLIPTDDAGEDELLNFVRGNKK